MVRSWATVPPVAKLAGAQHLSSFSRMDVEFGVGNCSCYVLGPLLATCLCAQTPATGGRAIGAGQQRIECLSFPYI